MTKLRVLAKILGVIIVSESICLADQRVIEDRKSPDGAKSLQAVIWDDSQPESSTRVRLIQSKRTIWSKTFMARFVRFSWTPDSRYALIEVDHLKDGLLTEKLYLLDLEDTSQLSDLPLEALVDKIGEAMPDEGEGEFGYRGGMNEPVWRGDKCKLVYLLGAGTCVGVIVLDLDAKGDHPPLTVESHFVAKTEKELDEILKRIGAGKDWE